MLEIKSLTVAVGEKIVLENINLTIKNDEVHFLMGPNGAGKSSLGFVLMGHPDYKIKAGKISFSGKDVSKLSPDKRAKLGLFLAFQAPPEFEGVELIDFLTRASSSVSREKGGLFNPERKISPFLKELRLKEEFLKRELNLGFSGGEKKKSELLQLLFLKPKLAILDEIDSGLDVDNLKAVCKTVSNFKKSKGRSLLIITHLPRIARFLKPNFVHIMADGKIIKRGGKELLQEIEKGGYKQFVK
jgi:Fe-S cluster assembly ATP-binding protein